MPSDGRSYYLPEREFVDVTPELLAAIVEDLPEHDEGDYAITVKTDSLKRLLYATGAVTHTETSWKEKT